MFCKKCGSKVASDMVDELTGMIIKLDTKLEEFSKYKNQDKNSYSTIHYMHVDEALNQLRLTIESFRRRGEQYVDNYNKGGSKIAEGEDVKFYVLDSGTHVNTLRPKENEYISSDWEDVCYFLIETGRYASPIIIAGSGKSEGYGAPVGSRLQLFDDINGTTKFPAGHQHKPGAYGNVLALANSPEQITSNFPEGRYRLMVLK